MSDPDPYRLARTVIPHRYDLHLSPDLDSATFTGSVAAAVEVTEPVSAITLNAIELTIDAAWVEVGGTRVEATVTLDDETERAVLDLASEIGAGPASVHIDFAGVLNDKLRGFYRSTFTDDDGVEQVIATTQFEATDARRAFPCWDEPDMKAVFAVTLDVAEGLLALSNAAEVSAVPVEGGRCRFTFADTMVMSTYLLAFVVGPLVVTGPVEVDGVPLRIVHRAGQEPLTPFALESGAFALRHFSEYFGTPYPADKLDLVAIPDFAFGAMENLGCVTFRDALLLIDPERSTQPELQRVADVIHHEIAHMWFGDLVTMKWWNGIWLNEAFATFMEMHCTDAFRPEWDRWTSFGAARTAAFDTDALPSTRPIEFEVVSPVEAEGMFDVLTYEKGAAVVRMLEQYLGAERFRDGIRLYITRHAHGNTETTDLWDAIEEATGEPVRKIMDSWIFGGGYPEVRVQRNGGAAGPARLRLSQRRFRYVTGETEPAGTGDRWAVPVLLRWSQGDPGDGTGDGTGISGQRVERVLLEGTEVEIDLEGPTPWVLANSGGHGFFRVRYDRRDRAALASAAAAGQLSPLERYCLLDDAGAGLLSATVSVGEVLALIRVMADETDLWVWQRILSLIDGLGRLVDDGARPDFEAWVRALVAPALMRFGLDPVPGEPDRDSARRAALFATLGTVGADDLIQERSRELWERGEGDGRCADLFDAAVRVMAAHGDGETFAAFRERHRVATNPQERLRFLGALADFPGDAEIDAFVRATLTDEVRSQDAPFVLRRALTNRTQGGRVWRYISAHCNEVAQRFPTNSISRLLEGIRSITDAELAAEIDGFLEEHPVEHGAQQVEQHRERMRAVVALRQRAAADLTAALRSPGNL